MMLRRDVLLAMIVLSAVARSTTAAEPAPWTVTITPQGGNARVISISGQDASPPILLAQHASTELPGKGVEPVNPGSRYRAQPDDSVVSVSAVDAAADRAVDHAEYRRVYASIPFSRTEYDANPGYRHEATLELLLGQLRPRIVFPAGAGTNVRVDVGWPQWFYPRRYGDRTWSRYMWR